MKKVWMKAAVLGLLLGTAQMLGLAQAQQVKLRFTTWAGGDALTLLNTLAEEYSKQNPNVKVEVEVTPFASYDQRMAVQIAAGTPPDVGWVAERSIPGYIENKALSNIRAAVAADNRMVLGDYSTSALELWTRGNDLYGLPFSFSPMLLYYNRDLFEKAGVPTPAQYLAQNRWNYDTFRQAAEAIKKADPNVYGASVFRLDPQAWAAAVLGVMYAHGGGVFNRDLSACAMDSAGSVKAWELVQAMMGSGVSPRLGEQVTFASGRLGMYADQISYTAQLRQVNFKWDVAPMPAGPSGRITFLGQAGYAVFAGSKNQKEATDFLKYMSSIGVMKRTAQFFPPPRGTLLNSSTFLSGNPLVNSESLRVAVVQQVRGSRTLIVPPNWAQINDVVVRNLERLLRPQANVREEMGRICQEMNPLLKK